MGIKKFLIRIIDTEKNWYINKYQLFPVLYCVFNFIIEITIIIFFTLLIYTYTNI